MTDIEDIYFLVGFEESQEITIRLRAKGIKAFSCDIQDCSGGHPEWHLKMDIKEALLLRAWSGIILHSPCTFTALCGNRWYYNSPLRPEGVELCKSSWDMACELCDNVALEQPKTIMQRYIGKRSQTIHPWQFGHKEMKETWLWLKGFPNLNHTDVVGPPPGDKVERRKWEKIWLMSGKDRSKKRSKTYPGIAEAIADQWGSLLKHSNN